MLDVLLSCINRSIQSKGGEGHHLCVAGPPKADQAPGEEVTQSSSREGLMRGLDAVYGGVDERIGCLTWRRLGGTCPCGELFLNRKNSIERIWPMSPYGHKRCFSVNEGAASEGKGPVNEAGWPGR